MGRFGISGLFFLNSYKKGLQSNRLTASQEKGMTRVGISGLYSVTIHRLPVCYNHQTCLPDLSQDPPVL